MSLFKAWQRLRADEENKEIRHLFCDNSLLKMRFLIYYIDLLNMGETKLDLNSQHLKLLSNEDGKPRDGYECEENIIERLRMLIGKMKKHCYTVFDDGLDFCEDLDPSGS